MPHYLPPDYLDNTGERRLAGALQQIIADLGQRRLDVVTRSCKAAPSAPAAGTTSSG